MSPMKALFLFLLIPLQLLGQSYTLDQVKNYPFPTALCTTKDGSKLAWAFDEQGKRNVYVAEAPDYKPRRLTDYTKDDGQEITSLTISEDGNWVVFVRGGDHGSNWDLEGTVNPSADPFPAEAGVVAVPFSGGKSTMFESGDSPVISPDSKRIAFLKGGQVWGAPVDSIQSAKTLFKVRGTVHSLEWAPDASSLVFVSDRNDHSLIGIYTNSSTPIRWVSPSFSRDVSPRWSPDGKRIVFVRLPPTGGAPDSLLARRHRPWSIYTADLASVTATRIWDAPRTLKGSIPNTHGGYNLHWAANDRIVFLSYMDGWPHLYSLKATGGSPLLLTPGNFMCEHIALSPDRKFLTFSANTGPDPLDLERRHAAMVSVDKADMRVLTPGSGLEWAPLLIGQGRQVALISATPQRPPLPGIVETNGASQGQIRLLGLDHLPADFPKDQLVTPQAVTFKAADGVTVHADLFMPAGGPARKPALIYVHGGPPRQMLLGWHYSDYYSNAYAANQYLASLGFVVLSVNYRLGIGYGYEFHNAPNSGPGGAAEYQDIKAAGEWLRKQNFTDPARIGVYGGSYGGYLTAMALAKDSKLFAAGVDIHGVHDWAKWARALVEQPGEFEKAPDYEKALQTAWQSSPVAHISTWTSPVMIIHSDDDRNVQFSHSTDLINRLEKKGVTYETLMIVDDTHHWMKWTNAVTVYKAVADFFVRKFLNPRSSPQSVR